MGTSDTAMTEELTGFSTAPRIIGAMSLPSNPPDERLRTRRRGAKARSRVRLIRD
jgi:hypothetical protein